MKTKTLNLLCGALVAFLFIGQSVSAQERERFRLSVGPEVGLPLGDFGDAFDWSIGGSVQGDYAIYQNDLYVTLNAGFTNYIANDAFSNAGFKDLQLIPVKAGLKYFLVSNFYVQAEAGASFVANKDDVGAQNSTVFTYSPQVGYLLPLGGKNYLDAGIRFEGNSKLWDGGSSNNFLGLRVAYSFGL